MKIYIEKDNTLKIDENTELVLLNVEDFVSHIKRESSFVPAGHIKVSLKYKLNYNNCEYYGESIFNSYSGIKNSIDDNSPYKVELVNWKLSDEEEKYLEFNFVKKEKINTQFFELKDKKEIYDEMISHYSYKLEENIKNIKLQICYFICNSDKIELQNVEFNSNDGEAHIWLPNTLEEKYDGSEFKEKFKDISFFCQEYEKYPYLLWKIKAKYCNTEILINSVHLQNDICVSYSTNADIDIMPLLCEVKNKLYEINDLNVK